LDRNEHLFENKISPPFKVSQQVIELTHFYKASLYIKKPRLITPLSIDNSMPWGFFMGPVKAHT
jgi:hypothetical protein